MDIKETSAPRITVFDAAQLDDAIHGAFKRQYQVVTSYLPLGIVSKFEPEVDAALKLLLWMWSFISQVHNGLFGPQLTDPLTFDGF